MSKKLYEESSIQDIANAIRSKNGSTNTYKVSEMATAINDISVGSSNAVLYTPQTLTDAQKLQARTNIGASATLPAVLETFIDAFEDGAENYVPVSTNNNNWNPKKLIIAYTGDASELTGNIPTTDWINGFLTAALANKLDKTGGTLTGNLTGKYITGTWLQTTAATDLNKTPPKIAVLDASGWVYYRTLDELKTDLGVTSSGGSSSGSSMKAMESIGGYLGIPTADIPTNGIIYVHISNGGDITGGDPQMYEGTLKIENGTVAGRGDNILNISSTGVTKAGRTARIDIGIAFYGLTANNYVGVYQVISE